MPATRGCTRQEEEFCLEYVRTGGDREAAMLKAYPASAKWKGGKNRRARKAYDILQRPRVQERLKELMAPVIQKAQCDLDTHLRDLADLRDKAAAVFDFQAAVKAEELRGKAAGLYIERSENTQRIAIVRVPPKARSTEEWLETYAPKTIEHQGEVCPQQLPKTSTETLK